MSDARHQRLEELFLAGAALPDAERVAWLDANCADDPALRAELADLLARDEAAGGTAAGAALEARVAAVATPGGAAAGPGAPSAPRVIGPYTLLERIGEGGFGEVFAAEQSSPVRRRVALKVLRPGMQSKAVLARFEAERQALALMDHPGIAKVHDAGETADGRPYFVMELITGESITTYCERHALPLRKRLELLVAVCRAVEHAHQKGVIHRDLKPSNILVATADGAPLPKVIDFGIAKATRDALALDTLHTRQGEFLGTPEYTSPEQAGSSGADVDTRSDVYSLGVVLYRLSCGALPFEPDRLRRAGLAEMVRILREEDPPRPSERIAPAISGAPTTGTPTARELRGDLDWIVLRAMEKDRERRYASAAALADDLERHLRDEPVLAGPPGTTYRIRKLVRRHRGLVFAGAVVGAVLVVGVVATAWQAARARVAEREARAQAETSAAVNAFLTSMLGAANPEENPGARQTTVREMLERAARELDASPPAVPAVEAGVRHALGTTYMGIGLYDEAEPQLRRAVALRLPERASVRRAWTPDPDALSSPLALADLEMRRSNVAGAESLLTRLEPYAVRADVRARFLELRGGVFAANSRFAEADSVLELAIAARRALPGEPNLSNTIGDLASSLLERGRFAEAESLGREALATARRLHPGDHHEVAFAAGRLANTLQRMGSLAEAESLLRVSMEIDHRVLGPEHPIPALTLSNLAIVLQNQGRLPEAEEAHRRALEQVRGSLGEEHREVAVLKDNLATVLQLEAHYDEALALRTSAIATMRRLTGDRSESVAIFLNNLGSLQRLMKRYPEAESAFREAIEIWRPIHGADHPNIAIATHNIGRTMLDAHRARDAEPMLRSALDQAVRVFPPGHPNTAIFQATYGRALGELGRYAEAERLLLDARTRIAAALGDGHPRTLGVAGDLADLYGRWGRPGEAARWRRIAGGR